MIRWNFRAYSKSQNRILTPEEASLAGVWLAADGQLTHHPDIRLLHYTGRADSKGEPLFEFDVCEFDQITEFGLVKRNGFMKFIDPPGHYSIAMEGDERMAGAQYETQQVVKIGNLLVDPTLVKNAPKHP